MAFSAHFQMQKPHRTGTASRWNMAKQIRSGQQRLNSLSYLFDLCIKYILKEAWSEEDECNFKSGETNIKLGYVGDTTLKVQMTREFYCSNQSQRLQWENGSIIKYKENQTRKTDAVTQP